MIEITSLVGRPERRFHWRTWNLLSQIIDATDGNAPWQQNESDCLKGLCVVDGDNRLRALRVREWVDCIDWAECEREFSDKIDYLPVWAVTTVGRAALVEAKLDGLQTV